MEDVLLFVGEDRVAAELDLAADGQVCRCKRLEVLGRRGWVRLR